MQLLCNYNDSSVTSQYTYRVYGPAAPPTSAGVELATGQQAANDDKYVRGGVWPLQYGIQKLNGVQLWLYFCVYRKSDLWQDINDAILIFCSAKIATFWAINV